MQTNIFGNLDDWGTVLGKLKQLSETRELDRCQEELIRLLRFDHNWRLREAAIESLPFVTHPKLTLIREVLSLVKRKDLYYDVRILATDGLEKLTAAIVNNRSFDTDILKQFVLDVLKDMDGLLASPEPPVFHDALNAACEKIRKIEAAF